MKNQIKIDVVSDVVCPWCYIGKRRLENAIKTLENDFDFEIEYHPFELNPQIPASGLDQKGYLTRKFGGEDRYAEITSHVTEVAAQEQLVFDFERQKVSPNTRKAHALIAFAKSKGVQPSMVEILFNAYFSSGINLADDENLIKAALEAGLDEAEVRAYLNDHANLQQVEQREKEMSGLGITGVPFYIINNRYGISGAQATETFIRAFAEITGAASPSQGEACDVDGKNC